MSLHRLFNEHPASVGESYFGHLATAAGFALRMIGAGIACLLHAVFPFLFVRTGSDCIQSLHSSMSARRAQGASKVASARIAAASAKPLS
jgi:hypothetical protein